METVYEGEGRRWDVLRHQKAEEKRLRSTLEENFWESRRRQRGEKITQYSKGGDNRGRLSGSHR